MATIDNRDNNEINNLGVGGNIYTSKDEKIEIVLQGAKSNFPRCT